MRDRVAKAALDAWFGKSAARNAEGVPQIVYRGEHGAPQAGDTFQSRLNSLSFGDTTAANTYAMSPNNHADVVHAPRVTPGYLKIEKPIIHNPDDPFIELGHLEKELGTEEASRIAHKFDKDIRYTNNWEENYAHKYDNVPELLKAEPQELRNLYFDTYKYLDDPHEVARLKARGYDGAIHVGNGETADQLEYRIFDPANFKSAIPRIYTVPGAVGLGALATQDNYAGAQP